LFLKMKQNSDLTYEVRVSFLELYMEKVFDLLSKNRNEEVDIREDPKNGIRINGLTETIASTWEDTLRCLEQGSHNRRTGATAMNHQSSRSHAVFTLTINQIDKVSLASIKSSKFHLVDLAGSERASKTHAVGERFAEGVNINKGLLALGNVISALCEGNPNRHIPYRDSKLTRLLQDSLGGNSHTLMIACTSPADSNYEETLSTLRYADRTRKIKNKPIVNQDPTVAEIASLRLQVQQLLAGKTGGSGFSCTEMEQLRQQLKYSEEEKIQLTQALQSALEENTNMCEKALMADVASQQMKHQLDQLKAQAEQTLGTINQTLNETRELDGTKTVEQVLSLKAKIEEIQEVHRKGEIDLANHELNNDRDDQNLLDEEKENDADSPVSSNRLSKFGSDMALRQATLSKDLKELNGQLAMRVNMLNKMSQQDQSMDVQAKYEATVNELEDKVSMLHQEKEGLLSALAQVSNNANVCKLSEQRRKRLQELEPQISELRKKIQEQANIIKIKQRTDEQLKRISNEIQVMKANRVKLVRQMREENEKYRVWRQQKEREVTRLKDQDRKRQGQLQRMETLHTKQQNVLRRKMEDAMAVSKRLKEALSLNSQKLSTKAATNSSENDKRIKGWLMGELNLLTSTTEAEQTLNELIESRKVLSARQTKLQAKLDNAGENTAFAQALMSEIANVGGDLDVRTEQIVELKQKIGAADLETKAKTRLDYLQIEAKMALKFLFEESAACRVQMFAVNSEVQDLRAEYEDIHKQHDEAQHQVARKEAEIVTMRHKNQSELGKLTREYDERMLTLMRQLPPCGLIESVDHKVSEKEVLERLKIQQEELERCCGLQQQLNTALNEVEELKTQLSDISTITKPIKSIKKKTTKKTFQELPAASISSEDDLSYDSDDDPEWRQTPMFKRIKKLREEASSGVPPKMSEWAEPEKKTSCTDLKKEKTGKRMSRSHCACRVGGCKNCICSKDKRACSKECGCSSTGNCKNSISISKILEEDPNRNMNETFDMSRKRSQPMSKENSLNGEDADGDDDGVDVPWKKSRKLARKGAFFEPHVVD